MKKDAPFIWDDACQKAFEEIKGYLLHPPVLAAPIPGHPLILYTTALDNSLGALLAQNNEDGKENALYYLSRRLVGAEASYSPIERQCLALIFAVKKLRHYLLSHKVNLISKVDPLKFLMTRPTLTGRLARWALILMEFDITYVPQKAVKGQALADFLAAHPISDNSPLNFELPQEETLQTEYEGAPWELYFDGASSIQPAISPNLPKIKAGVGLVFVTPQGGILQHSLALTAPCTNNEAEYEALIAGLEFAAGLNVQELQVYGDSQLIIRQMNGDYQVRKPELQKYYDKAREWLDRIPSVSFNRVSRAVNGKADALAKLAKELADPDGREVQITVRSRLALSPAPPVMADPRPEDIVPQTLVLEGEDDWREPIINYFKSGALPEDKSEKHQIKKRVLQYAYVNDTLYRRSFDQMWLRCVAQDEAQQIIHEVHSGICGAHQSGPKMYYKIKRLGYYWPAMVQDCNKYARKCHLCQIHGDRIHQHPNPLHPTVSSWPFEIWGTDIIGPIEPPSSAGHRFILAATDYFSKWTEAVALREVKANNVVRFFKDHILSRFGVPRRIISDNGLPFRNSKVYKLAVQYNIDWRYSTIYNPRANGLAEAFNKTLIKLLKKLVIKNARDWHLELSKALWAYRTTYRTPTQSTPYSLVFGAEAVLPLEVELPSLRIAMRYDLTSEENARLRLEELDTLEEKRLEAQQSLELYRSQMAKAYAKSSQERTFKKGELVLVLRRPIITNKSSKGKFSPNWEGPFVVEIVCEGGAYQLIDSQGDHPMPPINGRFLKKYYA